MAQPQGPSGEETHPVGMSPGSAPDHDPYSKTTTGSPTRPAPGLGQRAREAAEDVRREARDVASQVKEEARATAARQKDAAAERMDGFAHALQAASEDLRGRGQEFSAAYVQQAADGLERATNVVRERDVDQLLGTVEDFARRQPVAFLGGAVAVGFGLARMMKSSADRRHGAAPHSTPSRGGFSQGDIA